jgi:hypothetical protein
MVSSGKLKKSADLLLFVCKAFVGGMEADDSIFLVKSRYSQVSK